MNKILFFAEKNPIIVLIVIIIVVFIFLNIEEINKKFFTNDEEVEQKKIAKEQKTEVNEMEQKKEEEQKKIVKEQKKEVNEMEQKKEEEQKKIVKEQKKKIEQKKEEEQKKKEEQKKEVNEMKQKKEEEQKKEENEMKQKFYKFRDKIYNHPEIGKLVNHEYEVIKDKVIVPSIFHHPNVGDPTVGGKSLYLYHPKYDFNIKIDDEKIFQTNKWDAVLREEMVMRLKEKCNKIRKCIAFDSYGNLFSDKHIIPKYAWWNEPEMPLSDMFPGYISYVQKNSSPKASVFFPFHLQNEDEKMDWFKNHIPELYEDIKKNKNMKEAVGKWFGNEMKKKYKVNIII